MFRPFYDRAFPLAISPLNNPNLAGMPQDVIQASIGALVALTMSYSRYAGMEGWVKTFTKVCTTLDIAIDRLYGPLSKRTCDDGRGKGVERKRLLRRLPYHLDDELGWTPFRIGDKQGRGSGTVSISVSRARSVG